MPEVIAVPRACPKCKGPVWDNREKKRTGPFKATAPDFKCKDKKCEEPIWPPKNGEIYADEVGKGAGPLAGTVAKVTAGIQRIPGDEPDADFPGLSRITQCHKICWDCAGDMVDDLTVRAAIAATLLIAAQKQGLLA